MKKVILFSILLFVIKTTYSQQVSFGIKGGGNLAEIHNSSEYAFDSNKILAYHAGIMLQLKINRLAIQSELLYSIKGSEIAYVRESNRDMIDYKDLIKLNYLTLPISFKIFIVKGFNIQAGPQIGFLLDANKTISSNLLDKLKTSTVKNIIDDYNKFDTGVNFGTGYTSENFDFSIRYCLGMSDIAKERIKIDNNTKKNGVFQVSVGVFF